MTLIQDIAASLREIFSPPFRAIALLILSITIALLLLLGLGLHHWLSGLATLPYGWLQTLVSVLEGLGILIAAVFLVAPTSALVAGFFVDGLAERVERDIDPTGPKGNAIPTGQALWLSVRFALLSLIVTLLALLLLLVPGLNAVAFLGANAYLSGRQYFEFAALRFHPVAEANRLRQAHAAPVYLAGFCIALFLSVPILNLLTPLFGTALMVRVYKRVSGRRHLSPPSPWPNA